MSPYKVSATWRAQCRQHPKEIDDPIRFYHYQKDGFDLLWALGQLSNPKNIRDPQVAVWFCLQSKYATSQASGEQPNPHPEMDAVETWTRIRRSGYSNPAYTMVEGTPLRSKTSLLAELDVSHFPCEPGRNPAQCFAWNMFHNTVVIVFFGSDAQLFRSWFSSATTESKPRNTTNAIDAQTRHPLPTQTSFQVCTSTLDRLLHAYVVAAPFGPFQNWSKAMDQSFDVHVYGAGYNHPESAALAH